MRYAFQSEQWLPYPVEKVFTFFASPDNLPHLMPSWQKARIEQASIAPPPPRPVSHLSVKPKGVAAGSGTRLTLSFRPFPHSPLRVSWEAVIEDFAWNERFCDCQLRGPFSYWRHCHTVQPHDNPSNPAIPGTLLRDHVEYEPPLGPLGAAANLLFIDRQLCNTFNFRHTRTLELLALSPSR